MLWWVRAALALSVVLFIPGLRDCFEPPKAAVLRTLGMALLALALFPGAAGGWPRRSRLDLVVLLWLATEVAATLFSRSPLLSLIGEPMQREGLLTSLALGGIYLAVASGPRSDRADTTTQTGTTLAWMIAAVTLSCLYALAQSAGVDPIRWVGGAVYAPGGALARPSGTLGHPNLLGVMSAAATVGALALAATAPRRRMLFAIAAAITGAATIVTLSRAAWLGLLIGALLALVLAARSGAGARASRTVWLAGGALVIVAVVFLLAAGWGERLMARMQEMLAPTTGAGASRIEIWRSAVLAWRSSPWLGTGPDTFALLFSRFQTPAYWRFEWGGIPYHAHSILFHELATRGLLGLLACLAWAGVLIATARNVWRETPAARPAVCAILSSLTAAAIAGLFGSLGVVGAFWIVLGSAMLTALARSGAGGAPIGGRRPPAHSVRGGAAIVLAMVVAWFGIGDLRASASARAADQWLDLAREGAGNVRARALAAASEAARLSPLDDALLRLRSDALLGAAGAAPEPRRPLLESAASARRALQLEPLRIENHEQLARVLTGLVAAGDPAARTEALAEIERVVASAPDNALMLGECARLELLLGRPDRARAIAHAIATLYPDHAETIR